jgi:hypothetical protein
MITNMSVVTHNGPISTMPSQILQCLFYYCSSCTTQLYVGRKPTVGIKKYRE